MAGVTLTEEQLNTVITISKDVQERVKANGMPELDEDLAEMIELLEAAAGGSGVGENAPLVASLDPESMNVPGPDAPILVIGSGFTEESVIIWNGGDEETEFVSPTKVRTTVKVSTVEAPLPFTLPVQVRNEDQVSNALQFTFTEAPIQGRRK